MDGSLLRTLNISVTLSVYISRLRFDQKPCRSRRLLHANRGLFALGPGDMCVDERLVPLDDPQQFAAVVRNSGDYHTLVGIMSATRVSDWFRPAEI